MPSSICIGASLSQTEVAHLLDCHSALRLTISDEALKPRCSLPADASEVLVGIELVFKIVSLESEANCFLLFAFSISGSHPISDRSYRDTHVSTQIPSFCVKHTRTCLRRIRSHSGDRETRDVAAQSLKVSVGSSGLTRDSNCPRFRRTGEEGTPISHSPPFRFQDSSSSGNASIASPCQNITAFKIGHTCW